MKLDLSVLNLGVPPVDEDGCVGLAGVRRALRNFLRFGEIASTSAGTTTQQYQVMLEIRASRKRRLAVLLLADGLLIKPNAAVQLVEWFETIAMARRDADTPDRRVVHVPLTGVGNQVVAVLAAEYVAELVCHRQLLVESLRLKTMAN